MNAPRLSRPGLVAAFALALAACGSTPPESSTLRPTATTEVSTTSGGQARSASSNAREGDGASREPVRVLTRADVRETVDRGLGRFLGRLEVSAVRASSQFVGFELVHLDTDLARCGLRPGDVVTRVNGASIERPDQAFAVFSAAPDASELIIEYQRGGQRQELRLGIVD